MIPMTPETTTLTDMPAPAPAPGRAESPAPPPAARHHRSPVRIGLYGLLAVATVGFSYLALRSVHFNQVWRALRDSDYIWLIPALAAFAASTMARALRWHALFAPGRRPPLGSVTNAMLVGYLFNNIMPARAGEAARVVTLTKRAGTPAAESLGTVVVERVFDVLSILIVFFAAAPWLPQVSWFRAAELAAVVLAVGLIGVIVVLAVYGDRPLHFVLRPLGRMPGLSVEKVQKLGAELVDGLHGLRRPRVALAAFGWSLSAWVLSSLSAWLVTFAFHLHLGFDAGVLVTVAIGAGMILPSPPAAVGVFEAAVLLALQAYGLDQTRALPYALILHMVNFLPFLLAGGLALQYNATTARRRTRLATAEGTV